MDEVTVVGELAVPLPEDREVVGFEDFVAARSVALWRSAYLLTGDHQRAEDLLQTALVKTWRRWDRIRDKNAAEAYVRAALMSTYTDWWRRRWSGEVPTADLPEQVDVGAAAGADVRRDVLLALAQLPRGQRAVIVLRYFDDLTERQTAAALGCSVGTVKSQTSRAMATLRACDLLTPTDVNGDPR